MSTGRDSQGAPHGARRALLRGGMAASIASAVPWLAACDRRPMASEWDGGWVGEVVGPGHAWRDASAARSHPPAGGSSAAASDATARPVVTAHAGTASFHAAGRAEPGRNLPRPDETRRTQVAIVGAGIGGLAAARALRRQGVEDLQVFELADAPGGNARGHRIGGLDCPLGAHYLPVPGAHDEALRDFLIEAGLARHEHGRFIVDERHLAHSPQERLFVQGQWVEGLMPPVAPGSAAARQMQHFARQVAAHRRSGLFRLPGTRLDGRLGAAGGSNPGASDNAIRPGTRMPDGAATSWPAALSALDALPFATWLDQQGCTDPTLRAYLDYVCRDDYGASARRVSAWAGVHYFASRHGFSAPGLDPDDAGRDEEAGVITFPEGNARLVQALATPLGDRLHTGHLVLAVREGRHGVEVDVRDLRTQRLTRWQAARVVLAVPLFLAARLLDNPPAALPAAAAGAHYAPWLVANLLLSAAPQPRLGAAPAWDNVLQGSPALGYVDAGHQSRVQQRPEGAPRVWTAYWALGGDDAAQARANRHALLAEDWRAHARRVIDDLATAHPDLPGLVRRADLARHGHAMSIPEPGRRGDPALAALRAAQGRVRFAHADLAGYSVFEEAFALGEAAAR